MSSHDKEYVDSYKMGVRDYHWTFQDKSWTFLGSLPAHSNDNYTDFYLGEHAGSDAYCNPTMHTIVSIMCDIINKEFAFTCNRDNQTSLDT
jgi:hypothetical protein